MSVRDDLIRMRELLTPEGSWCQGAPWKNARGHFTGDRSEAVSMCLMGAALLAESKNIHETMCFLDAHCPPIAIMAHPSVQWQDEDGRTHEEVLALLDRCIADCASEASVLPSCDPEWIKICQDDTWTINRKELELV